MTPEEMFFKYDYGETKDLLKSFLTISIGTLVLSITFAEKVVDFKNSLGAPRRWIIACWSLLSASIILAGLSMCLIAAAVAKTIYKDGFILDVNAWYCALSSWALILVGGIRFVAGLICMIMAALSQMKRSTREAHPAETTPG